MDGGGTDEELLEKWRGGDNRAGETLFNRYVGAIERFFKNKVDDSHDDLMQETFLQCVKGRERIVSFRRYLFGVARNVLMKHLGKRYRCREEELSSRSFHDLAPGPSTLIVEIEQMMLLALALRRLPVERQVIFELYYWEQMTSSEIAEVLGVKAPWVRNHLVDGRKQLKRIILEDLGASPKIAQNTVAHLEQWVERLRQHMHALSSTEPDFESEPEPESGPEPDDE